MPQGDKPEVVNFKQDEIVFANRAPTAKDKGLFWVHDAGTAATLYVRSKKAGTWFAQS